MNFDAVSLLFKRVFPNPNDPGACLMIARYGEPLYMQCAGLANLETAEAVTSETNFRLASVTKQFTAAAILLLRGQGKLTLEDRITKFFPDLPAWGATITIRNLLQHTAGLLDYEDHVPADATEPVLDADVLAITKAHDHTYFPPGTQFRYSNTGYALLACVVEQLTETSFSASLEDLIFRPLRMDNTVVMHKKHRPHVINRALGYWRLEDGTIVEADQNLTSAVLGDGGIYCSAVDYLKWDRALWQGVLLPREVVVEAMTAGTLRPQSLEGLQETGQVWFPDDMNEPEVSTCVLAGGVEEARIDTCAIPYGLGWRLETNAAGYPVAYHPGSTTGFNNCVRRIPDLGLTVLVLANRTSAGSKELARDTEADCLAALQLG